MTVYVAEIDGRAIAAFNAENEIQAEGRASSKAFRGDLTRRHRWFPRWSLLAQTVHAGPSILAARHDRRNQRSPSVTPLPRTGPLFQFRFPKKSGPPHFQNSVKASACCLIYSGLSSTLQSAVAQRRREATVYLRGNAEVLELD
jgi:hypothetical protein